jgi:hypothetical protein
VTKPALISIEGPKKLTRGGEWEPIKISQGNSAYILKSTRCPSLLTQLKLHCCKKLSSLGTRLGTAAET